MSPALGTDWCSVARPTREPCCTIPGCYFVGSFHAWAPSHPGNCGRSLPNQVRHVPTRTPPVAFHVVQQSLLKGGRGAPNRNEGRAFR